MITATIRATASMRHLAKSQEAMLKRAADIDAVVDEFKGYCLGSRLDNMWRNNGIIRGKWGLGSGAWAPNTEWVARAKGRNKPLYGSNDGRSIRENYHFNRRLAGRGKMLAGMGGLRQVTATLTLTNDAPQTKYLEKGIGYGRRIYPKRPGGVLAVPIAPGKVILLKSVRLGARKARRITGFVQGDLKWITTKAVSRALSLNIMGE